MGEKFTYQVKGFGFNAQPVKKVRRGKKERVISISEKLLYSFN